MSLTTGSDESLLKPEINVHPSFAYRNIQRQFHWLVCLVAVVRVPVGEDTNVKLKLVIAKDESHISVATSFFRFYKDIDFRCM